MLKDLLKGKVSSEELDMVPSSFEMIGSKEKSVAIVEIPDALASKEAAIAEAIMRAQKNVKSVLRKASGREGELRLRGFKLIAGNENTEVIHKENGYSLKLDPQKTYFSQREATERTRIARQVKPEETVMVMFSGIAPFCVAIARLQPKVGRVYGVELNVAAHIYGLDNVRMNKISHKIILINGDVREVCPRYFGKCDRVLMPLPMGSESFLEVAFRCLKGGGGIVHFYSWGEEGDLYSNALRVIRESAETLGKKITVLGKRKVLPYSPRKWKVCLDVLVE